MDGPVSLFTITTETCARTDTTNLTTGCRVSTDRKVKQSMWHVITQFLGTQHAAVRLLRKAIQEAHLCRRQLYLHQLCPRQLCHRQLCTLSRRRSSDTERCAWAPYVYTVASSLLFGFCRDRSPRTNCQTPPAGRPSCGHCQHSPRS